MALLPRNRHGPVDVDMVTVSRNNYLFALMVMRRAGDMDVVIVARNNYFLVFAVVVVVVMVAVVMW